MGQPRSSRRRVRRPAARRVRVVSFHRAGLLVPAGARALRVRAVELDPSGVMDWHSTEKKEEVIFVLIGQIQLEVRRAVGHCHRRTVRAGQCAFVSDHTIHRVVNVSSSAARYVYVTAPLR